MIIVAVFRKNSREIKVSHRSKKETLNFINPLGIKDITLDRSQEELSEMDSQKINVIRAKHG